MASLFSILDGYVLSGLTSNAAYDLLKLAWEKWTQKTWEEIYLAAFQNAVEEERSELAQYSASDGDIAFDTVAFLEVLRQDLSSSPEATAYSQLINDEFMAKLAAAMEARSVLMIGGNTLPPEGYAHLVRNLVQHSRDRFRKAIRADEESFRRMLQEAAEELLQSNDEIRAALRDVSAFLNRHFGLVIERLDIHTELLGNIQIDLQMLVRSKRYYERLQPTIRRPLRIFLAAPEDVADERTVTFQVCERLGLDPLLHELVTLDVITWDPRELSLPEATQMTPEEAVSYGLPMPSECDVVVLVLWSRMGEPLSSKYSKPDGSQYVSGLEWQLYDAMGSDGDKSAPRILVYRRTESVLLNLDDPAFEEKYRQYSRVKAFFSSLSSKRQSIQHQVRTYTTSHEFREQLEYDLRHLIVQLLKEREEQPFFGGESLYAPLPVEQIWKGSPFPGLRPFT